MPPEPQIVTVLGERVSLEPTGLPPSEKFLVSFDEKYKYPEMTDTESAVAKKLLRTFFWEESQPNPPCSDKEKEILLKSLRHRFASLRNELLAERRSQRDSLRLRQILQQFEQLKNYIDFAETVKDCRETDEALLAEALGDLTEDQILQLLRQFIFFILQGQHPLEEFTGRDPNPRGFVARLDRNPLPNFQEFLDKYRDKKYPVPVRIEQVLEATKLDLNAMKKGVDAELADKIQKIIALLKGVIPESDPFWESPLWHSETPDIVAIVDELLTVIKSLVSDLEECQDQMEATRRDIGGLEEARETESEEEKILRQKIVILEQEIKRLKTTVLGEQERKAIEANVEARIKSLQEQLTASQANSSRLANELKTKEEELQSQKQLVAQKEAELVGLRAAQGEVERLRAQNASLEEQLRAAQQRVTDCEEVQRRVKVLEGLIKTKEDELTRLRQHAGKLTQDIDVYLRDKSVLEQKILGLQEQLGLYIELKEDIEELTRRLEANKEVLLPILDSVQRKRSELNKEGDPVLAKLLTVKQTITESNGRDPSISSSVAEILKDVQEEVNGLEAQKRALEDQVKEKDAEIAAAEALMEEGNRLLALIRAGREDLQGKGFAFETDKEALEAAFKAVEVERDLQSKKTELETEVKTLTAQNQALTADMEALTARLASELEGVREELKTASDKLRAEEEKTSGLEGELATKNASLEQLQQTVTAEQEKARVAEAALETERTEAQQKLASLEQTKIQECEKRLQALREEEAKKREALITAQGGEKGELETRIAELLRQITTVEGERDAAKQEVAALKDRLQALQTEVTKQKQDSETTIKELETKLRFAEKESGLAKGETTMLATTVTSLQGELKDLRSLIIENTAERDQIFTLVSKVSEWILSGAKLPLPEIDERLKSKYRFDRILNAFKSYLPPEPTTAEETGVDPIKFAMTRCQLVFFMTYIYARHFPKRRDADSSYQTTLMEMFNQIKTAMYRALDVGIPGKLEPKGAAIPIQLKAKYMMNLLMPLLKEMELVHESGKRGADFLKFDKLEGDELETLRKLHHILEDILLTRDKTKYKPIVDTLKHYVIRKTGNVDNDIHELYLRFYRDDKIKQEFPVIMYVKEGIPEVSKFTFGSEKDFEDFLMSEVEKSRATLKLATPTEKGLTKQPLFSYNIMFYLFLFFVRDYLSSIEGELEKIGCPLPLALRSP